MRSQQPGERQPAFAIICGYALRHGEQETEAKLTPAASAELRTRELSVPRARVDAHTAALAAITAAGAVLRFSTLGVQSFWKDEAVTVVRILKPGLGATLSAIPHSEATPPLYYVLAWIWTRIFGDGEIGIRSLSALVGAATVPVVYLAAERIVSRRAALIAAALTAFSPYLIWYSQEARAYALLAFLCALSFLLFLRIRESHRGFTAWAVVCCLALATHYFAVFVVGAEALWLLWERRSQRTIAAVAGIAVAGAALLPLALHQERNGHDGWIHRLSLPGRVGNTVKFFLVGPSGTPSPLIPLIAGALVVAGAWMVLMLTRRRAEPAAVIAAAVIGIPLLLTVAGKDFFFHRNVIAAWPLLAIVLGAGFASRRAGIALAAALCAVFLVAVVAVDANPRYQRADWRSAANAIGHSPQAIVTPSLGDEPLEHYLPHTTMLHRRAAVSQITVIGWPLAHTPSPPPPHGFRLTERRHVGAFTLIRYRAAAPTPVSEAALAALHLGSDHPGILRQQDPST